ncbi:MAG TPA: polysaccharide biosynthesis/export family protein [Terracidiphilus sp.]|nr:polysaccharide biosynthesis/export family protein [Terracidiphilus sp.]
MWRHKTAWKRTMWIVATVCPLVAAPALAGQDSLLKADAGSIHAGSVDQQQPMPVLEQRPRYHIEPGDVLEVGFPISPEFDQTVTVAPDGYVSLRGAGDVHVAGNSLPEVRQAVYVAYARILNNPVVNVDLKDFQRPYFTVSGEVGHPGKFDLLGQNVTVAEALAMAGGTTINAKSSQVLLFRRLPGGSMVEVRKLDLKKMLKKGDLREDPQLQAGDLVYVPRNAFSTIGRFLPTSSLGVYATPMP